MEKKVENWKPPKEHLLFRLGSQFITSMTGITLGSFLFLFNNTRIYGQKIIDREEGPYIFASNHTSMFDSGFVDSVVFLKKALTSYYKVPYHTPEYGNFYKNYFLSLYMNLGKCIPLERGKGINQPSQLLVNEKLQNKGIVHIFPEGTRSRTGKLLPGKGGVGKRVYENKVKVIPCYHEGLNKVLPIGKYLPRVGKRVRIIIGEPIYFDDFFEKPNVPQTWREISQKIMDEIAKLKEELAEIESSKVKK